LSGEPLSYKGGLRDAAGSGLIQEGMGKSLLVFIVPLSSGGLIAAMA